MAKTAWVFPGQGSQSVGMGMDLLDLPTAREKFQQAEAILGWAVPDLCRGEDALLSRTLYTQPCLYVVSSILVDLLQQQGEQPDLLAGHSLGEYVALYAAHVFEFEVGLRLVKRRAELMDSASGGIMCALIGFDRGQLEAQIRQTPDVVLANDNHESQVVISGTEEAVAGVLSQVKVKRAVRLNVSGAFHSPLMAGAAQEFHQRLAAAPFTDAQVPVLSNVEPVPTLEAVTLKERLMQQMTGSVRWHETSLRLPVEGIERVVEIGPGKVLTGLVKRTCPQLLMENIQGMADLESRAAALVSA
ncbi:malonyl CoA-ACP transacylase [Neosynechococcus sphagnicola sy1]|uniref:Malonyl CoA-acyl carrier protein transacylase n=1 Tax=Neosynechococcus sphagnicola sy1 TaxID=1497020 RepID=A0A098TP30_9CYAN|nr:ACP S-malonyltransferase [Neosynechococcus sphagnicola]KGF74031.1 malonyl CoA-ACP transacylase [Neosynechococcus sphagnicola sy1]